MFDDIKKGFTQLAFKIDHNFALSHIYVFFKFFLVYNIFDFKTDQIAAVAVFFFFFSFFLKDAFI